LRTLRFRQAQRDVVEHFLPRQQTGVLEHHAGIVVQAVFCFTVATQVAVVNAFQPGNQSQ